MTYRTLRQLKLLAYCIFLLVITLDAGNPKLARAVIEQSVPGDTEILWALFGFGRAVLRPDRAIS